MRTKRLSFNFRTLDFRCWIEGKFNIQNLKFKVSQVGKFWILCWVLFLIGCQPSTKVQGSLVRVEQVVSGQTLEVVGSGDQLQLTERVRLIGIDAPDLEQRPWGPEARTWLESAIGTQPVLLEADVEERDRFKRRLAYLWRDGVLLNERMVAEGYALAVPRSPNTKYDQRLVRAQERARLMGLGIWNPAQPMRATPAEFRAQK